MLAGLSFRETVETVKENDAKENNQKYKNFTSGKDTKLKKDKGRDFDISTPMYLSPKTTVQVQGGARVSHNQQTQLPTSPRPQCKPQCLCFIKYTTARREHMLTFNLYLFGEGPDGTLSRISESWKCFLSSWSWEFWKASESYSKLNLKT